MSDKDEQLSTALELINKIDLTKFSNEDIDNLEKEIKIHS